MPHFLPIAALVCNAFLWGLSWWPFRTLQAAGLHPLWATALMYSLVSVALLLLRPAALAALLRTPGLWLLAVCAGLTNAAFNWAVSEGDVVRVVLLFYLMPAWAVLLAWRFLGERPHPAALLRLLLAFGGVLLVLWPAQGGLQQLARALSLADALALLGGFMFAATNVQLRHLQQVSAAPRMLAMFLGCLGAGLLGALAGSSVGLVPPWPAFAWGWMGIAALLALALMAGNWALQYGAARLPTSTTALVMLSEVLFASLSSVLLAGAALAPRTLAGGALIVLAALLAARRE